VGDGHLSINYSYINSNVSMHFLKLTGDFNAEILSASETTSASEIELKNE